MSEPRNATVVVRNKDTQQTALVHGAEVVSGFYRSLPNRGTRELLQVYSASPMIQALTRKIATTMATFPWKVYICAPNGVKMEVPNHIMSNMLNGGVPGLDGYQCRQMMALGKEMVGEAFALLDYNVFGVPYRRWPIPADWVKNVPSPKDEWFEVNPTGGRAGSVMVSRKNMIWMKDVDPANPYRRGVGIAGSLADEINADEAAAKHIGSSLTNRARPDLIISGSKEVPLKKADAERLHTVWEQRFGGPENAGKPFVSYGPITATPLTPSFKELDLTNLREFERDFMITVFGMPPEIMGVIENANRASIDVAEFLFMKHVIKPRMTAMAEAYTYQLAPMYDDNLIVGFDEPVQEDKEYKLEVMKSRSIAFTLDETRAQAGFGPLPDGEGRERPALNDTRMGMARQDNPDPDLEPRETNGGRRRNFKLTFKKSEELVNMLDDAVIIAALGTLVNDTITEFSTDTIDSLKLDIEFDMQSPGVADFTTNRPLVAASHITNTTRKTIRNALAGAVDSGGSPADIVRSALEKDIAERVPVIVSNEVVVASNFAIDETMRQSGTISAKRWITTLDQATRDSHWEMDGQVVPVGEMFRSGDGYTTPYPGGFGVASEDINCRCSITSADIELSEAKSKYSKIEDSRKRNEKLMAVVLTQAFWDQVEPILEELEG